jgi:hypothetical protein
MKSKLATVRAGTPSAQHDAMVAANVAQRERLCGPEEDAWAGRAGSFVVDPKRPLDALLTKIASYMKPDDVLIDVGGGAGRLSLPMALRCKEVVVVDPSPGMGAVFDKVLKDSGIGNARFVQASWDNAVGIEGDVALVAHVTYFVPAIAPFVQKLNAVILRRVIVCVRSVPPPVQVGPFFRLAHSEELSPLPGHEELLPVLEELGIAAELIDVGPATTSATAAIGKTHEEAIRNEVEAAKKNGWLGKVAPERLGELIDQHFDELLLKTDSGYLRRSIVDGDARDLLITWETP